jgi:hypothetical protein
MEITFWDFKNDKVCERVCTTLAEQVVGYIDMIETVKNGGYCMVTTKGRSSLLITKIEQLLR